MKECFTCKYKESRDLTKEEREELQRQHVEKTGRKTLFIPESEYTCKVSGNKIQQIDPACEKYEGDEFMESMRKSLSDTARKLREDLNKGRKS